jgi:xanthine dehydrogenase accessory factor
VPNPTVLILGASDLGTACALRLFQAGLHIIILEKDCPLDIYHSRSFSNAIFSGYKTIENIKAKTYAQALDEDIVNPDSDISNFIQFTVLNREIPVLLESDSSYLKQTMIEYCIVCETSLYENIKNDLPENIKILGFAEEINMNKYTYTICNSRLHYGRVLYANSELLSVESHIIKNEKELYHQIKAPVEGVFQSIKSVDDLIHEKDEIGRIGDIPILSPVLGRISGILNSGIIIPAGSVFAELDTSHSGMSGHVLTMSSFCLAGAILEAIMYDINS